MPVQVYRITLSGCDDHTSIDLALLEEQAELLRIVAAKSVEASAYGCQPIMEIEPIKQEEETT